MTNCSYELTGAQEAGFYSNCHGQDSLNGKFIYVSGLWVRLLPLSMTRAGHPLIPDLCCTDSLMFAAFRVSLRLVQGKVRGA
jgi:hypothetical protein